MFRQLRRHGFFGAAVILLLALGIGADTLIFSLVNELILKPLPVREPANLFLVEIISEHETRPGTDFPYSVYEQVFLKNRWVAGAVAEQGWSQAVFVPFSAGGASRLVAVQMVSPNYFAELGIRPEAGNLPVKPDAAVLSDRFWRSEFEGGRGALGSTIRVKDQSMVVAGVLSRDFHSSDLDRAPDIRTAVTEAGRKHAAFRILVRLAPGVSPDRAAAALSAPVRDALLAGTEAFRLKLEPAGHGISQLREQFSRALWLLMGAVVLLLLAVCANVAGLLLARSSIRQHELAIRSALGAGRWRLIRQLLGENLPAAIAGALLGAALAWAAAPQVVRLLPAPRDYAQFPSPQLLTITPDFRVLLFLTASTGFCVLAFGLVPAWRISLASEIKAGRGYSRATAGVLPVALQVAFSMVLLTAALLMLRTFRNLNSLNPGFDRDHVVSFSFDPQDAGLTPERASGFYSALRDRVSALPGVRSAAYASRGLMRAVGMKTTLAPQGVTLPERTFLNTSLNDVEPGYLETMGIPLLAGRNLRLADTDAKPIPIVVNRAFADFFFPGRSPLGQTLVQGTNGKRPPTHIVVGLTATAKYRSMREADPPTFYEALDMRKGQNWICPLYIRTWNQPAAVIAAVRKTASEIDSGVPLIEAVTLEQEIGASLWQERLLALLSGFFGVASLLMAAIGLYGALSQSVARRRRELGIRVAIGARFRHILQTVCRPMASAVFCGLIAGFAAAALLLRATAHLLFGIEPGDPFSMAAALGCIGFCAVLSAARPVLQALRTDPARALREE